MATASAWRSFPLSISDDGGREVEARVGLESNECKSYSTL
jgi:hypothetical protein